MKTKVWGVICWASPNKGGREQFLDAEKYDEGKNLERQTGTLRETKGTVRWSNS